MLIPTSKRSFEDSSLFLILTYCLEHALFHHSASMPGRFAGIYDRIRPVHGYHETTTLNVYNFITPLNTHFYSIRSTGSCTAYSNGVTVGKALITLVLKEHGSTDPSLYLLYTLLAHSHFLCTGIINIHLFSFSHILRRIASGCTNLAF